MTVPSRLGKEMSSTAPSASSRHHGIVVVSQLAQPAGLDRIHLGHRAVVRRDHREVLRGRTRLGRGPLAREQTLRFARVEPHGHRQLDAIVLHDGLHRSVVGRSGMDQRAIEPLGDQPRFPVGELNTLSRS